FHKQLGIGAGLGLRLDFNFFLIRMDLAFPLRAPQKDAGFVWTIDQINPFNKAWRQENLRYNLGIGYPF
ncbi:MAG TPA: BamA/TamA family outer membrane protein, partial [Saprospiraceae bacterium]|nr:BamA/TamA family outer membrane protein [Saprospiraceae bacterium]